ncbi:MAG: S9 family peptidase [Planctomycetes bacterium]|nr:S9 family peptidase [Planctomycetota bacterium]
MHRRSPLAPSLSLWLALPLLSAVSTGLGRAQVAWQYPATRKVEQIDVYHGTKVADPYRWLEDDRSAETAAWVEAQNAVSFGYLEKLPYRRPLQARLEALFDHPRFSAPSRKGPYVFFSKNDGLQNQSVLFVQKGYDGEPEVLIDPNTWSDDGTVRLTTTAASKDARYFAYGISKSGSDWQEYRVLELATKKLLDDRIEWVKVSGLAWYGDGFFYSRYPAPKPGEELSSKNVDHRVYYHRIGTPQSADQLVYSDEQHPQRFHMLSTTDDERFAVLSISDRGTGKMGNSLFVRDLAQDGTSFQPIVAEIGDDRFQVIDHVDGKLLVRTERGAPKGRVVRIDPQRTEEQAWEVVIAEKTTPLQGVASAGGKLFAVYSKDVTSRVHVHARDGAFEREIALPGLGSATGFGGNPDDEAVFYTFTSFTYAPTIFRYTIASAQSAVFRSVAIPGFDPAAYETQQVFYASKDGTKIPMFLVHKKGLARDGANPTLLYGYGGFNISQTPSFSALRLALLEQGFVYAVMNLRGGGEYGEEWHQAGTKLRKQNVFDDCIAAAEWLIASKITSPSKLALQGGSNGGLLVGAVINQRPELFAAAIPQVGVMDMLRFQKFTIGWNWIADYGSSDDPAEFKALYAYSPLHNIRAGVDYPATLITTADHDDRVVPAHSFKYAAALQEQAAKKRPALIRIETKSGHGASSTKKQIETTADVYAFLFANLGVSPRGLGDAASPKR